MFRYRVLSRRNGNYLKITIQEKELNEEYEKLNLSDVQRNIIMQWIDAIYVQESGDIVVVFRMNMQYCFSPLMQSANL